MVRLIKLLFLISLWVECCATEPVPVNSTGYLHLRYLVDRNIMPDGRLSLIYPGSRLSRQKSVLLAYNFLRHVVEDRGFELSNEWLGERPQYADVHRLHFLYKRLSFLLDHGIFTETGWDRLESDQLITRYEMIRMVYQILRSLKNIPYVKTDAMVIPYERLFKDVPQWHYAAPMLVALNKLGIIKQDWGENLNGDDAVDQIEAAHFLVSVIQFMKRNPSATL